MIDYKQIVIDSYIERQRNGISYKPYFLQQARINERDNFIELSDFFALCKRTINKMRQSIENYCNTEIKKLKDSIEYWENFIEDDDAWAQRVKSLGGIVNDYDLKKHQEEKEVDRKAKIAELKQEKENYKYEYYGYAQSTSDISLHVLLSQDRTYQDAYEYVKPTSGTDKVIPYNELLKMNQAADAVELEINFVLFSKGIFNVLEKSQQSETVDNENNEAPAYQKKRYDLKDCISMINAIFDVCTKWNIFRDGFTLGDLIQRFETADFSGNIHTEGNKTKIRVIIYEFHQNSGRWDLEGWYGDAVKSIGITKTECSKYLGNKTEIFREEITSAIEKTVKEKK